MTTRFHRDSSENLIVEIIKVIPETSKEKELGGVEGGQRGQRRSCLNWTKRLVWLGKGGGGTRATSGEFVFLKILSPAPW